MAQLSKAMTLLAAATLFVRLASAQPEPQPESEPEPPASTLAGEPFLTSPPKGDGPVLVRASFHLLDINDIDDEAETFEFEGVLTLRWQDQRQAFDPAELGVDERVYSGDYQFNELSPAWFPQIVLVNQSGLYERRGVILRVEPDGTMTLVEKLGASAEADLDLRRYPYDRHRVEAVFEVLGVDNTEVVLQAESDTAEASDDPVRTPQWTLEGVSTSTRDRRASHAGRRGIASAFVVTMDMRRESFFMVRLVAFPLVLIVMLSWSVFWMERSSLGDRISISFIGILTAVAYQMVVGEMLPQISYMTLMHGFLNLSFIIMCVTVVINLLVGALDRQGKSDAGDRVDRRCRWMFPLTYFGLIGVMLGVTFIFF